MVWNKGSVAGERERRGSRLGEAAITHGKLLPEYYGSSLTQIFRKLKGSLLSPWACNLIGAPSNVL